MKKILALLLVTVMIIPMGLITSFAEDVTDPYELVKHFTDVQKDAWYVDEVAYCVQLGYVSGMTETTFAPNANLTRAQFLTLLAKVDGVDLSVYDGKASGFSDVKPSHWYNKVVCWAVEKGYTSGLSETKFGPGNDVTRAQLARFFYVYTEKVGGDVSGTADISGYPDASKVQNWAKAPVEWAVNAGLISGVKKGEANLLDPNGNATRAQAARMIMVYTQLDTCEHVWGEWEVVTPATYEAAGEEQRVCTLCGKTETNHIPMLVCEKHTWSDWVITVEPTTETEGEQQKTCTLCGMVEIEVLPILLPCSHEWSEWTVTKEANTIETGLQERTCDLCGEVQTEDIPMIQKDYTITFDPDGGTLDEGFITTYPINFGDDYNDVFPNGYPTATLEGYVFMGWYLEEYGFLLNEPEFNGNSYALDYSCIVYAIYEEAPVYDERTPIALEVGTKEYEMPLISQYVIFELEPSETGIYTITIDNNVMGIVGYNDDHVTIEPDATTVADKSVTWTCNSVGQSVLVAVKAGRTYANITVSVEPIETE